MLVGIYIISCTTPSLPPFSTLTLARTRDSSSSYFSSQDTMKKLKSPQTTLARIAWMIPVRDESSRKVCFSPLFAVSRTPDLPFVPFFHEKGKYYNPLKNTSSLERGTRTLRLCTSVEAIESLIPFPPLTRPLSSKSKQAGCTLLNSVEVIPPTWIHFPAFFSCFRGTRSDRLHDCKVLCCCCCFCF